MSSIKLGVNIDHIATLRQARGTQYPDPVQAAFIAEQAGADGITIHLREDRRHIQDRDVYLLAQTIQSRLNLEMAVTEEMLIIACDIKPTYCCLVPEKREELTTEGGLEVAKQQSKIATAVERLHAAGIQTSLFIDPIKEQIDAAKAVGAPLIELHTGQYAEAKTEQQQQYYLQQIQQAADYAHQQGIIVNAGHGLHYFNTYDIAKIGPIYELNIGHSIIARAALVGLDSAVKEMKHLMLQARTQ